MIPVRFNPDSRSLSVRALGDVFETREYGRVCRVKRCHGCGCLSGQVIREVQVRIGDCCLCRERCEEPLVPVYGFQECAQTRAVLGRNVLTSGWTDVAINWRAATSRFARDSGVWARLQLSSAGATASEAAASITGDCAVPWNRSAFAGRPTDCPCAARDAAPRARVGWHGGPVSAARLEVAVS